MAAGTEPISEDDGAGPEHQWSAADLADHLQLALEAGNMGTFRWEMASGRTTWDRNLERLYGLPEGGFAGSFDGWRDMLHPDDRQHSLEVVERAVAEKTSYEIDHRVIWADGSVHWIRGRGKVTLDEHGNVTGTIGCSVDITDSKTREVETDQRLKDVERRAAAERLERERLEFLTTINTAALAATDHVALMRAVTGAAVPTLGDWCALVLLGEPGTAPSAEVAHSDPAKVDWAKALQEQYPYDPDAPTGMAAVVRTGVVEFIPVMTEAIVSAALDAATNVPRDAALAILDELQLTSIITVPLRTRRGTIGAMQFVNAESGRIYSEHDVALAEAAAGEIAVALDASWMADQQRELAKSLQGALLPPALPTIDGLSVAARYWPSGVIAEVGGDFYDVFALPDQEWAVVIGDVCGTGPDAAGVTAITRHTIRAAATHGENHTKVVEWTNDAVHAGLRDRFCTLVYSTIRGAGDGTWRYRSVSGGHPLPLVARAGGTVEVLGQPGDLVGVWPQISTTLASADLAPGDAVVLYTDGLTDLAPPYDLSVSDMTSMVAAAAEGAANADQIADRITAALGAVLEMDRRTDDMALLVLRVD